MVMAVAVAVPVALPVVIARVAVPMLVAMKAKQKAAADHNDNPAVMAAVAGFGCGRCRNDADDHRRRCCKCKNRLRNHVFLLGAKAPGRRRKPAVRLYA